jgi:hypothetical protein
VTWTPYAITFFISAFRGQHVALPILVTFACACFAKSSAIWIPLLYMSISTHFHLSLSPSNAFNQHIELNPIIQPIVHELAAIHKQDDSVIVRTMDKMTDKSRSSLT